VLGTLRVPLYLDDVPIRMRPRCTPYEKDHLDAVTDQPLRQGLA
jgi:hypothetical protein